MTTSENPRGAFKGGIFTLKIKPSGGNEEYGKDNNERAGAVRTDGHLPAKGVYYRSTQTKTGFTTPHFS